MSIENENEIGDLILPDKKKKTKTIYTKTELDENEFYPYGQLLRRFYNLLEDEKQQETKKTNIVCPRLSKYGKKTVFENSDQICTIIHRSIEILKNYLSHELSTEISVTEKKQLIIKGHYKQDQIESILRNFIEQYVMCSMCKLLNTRLEKDKKTRLYMIRCDSCGASKSVEPIKQYKKEKNDKKEID